MSHPVGTALRGVRTIADLKDRCIVEEGVHGCWIWRMASDKGTPKVWLPAKQAVCTGLFASLFLTGRTPTDGQRAYRTCTSPNCVRPNHVAAMSEQEWGARVTASGKLKTNVQRAVAVRRASRERKGNKVTYATAAEIRQAPGTLAEISAKFGVSKSQVSKIRRGEAWANEPVRTASIFSFAANLERQAA